MIDDGEVDQLNASELKLLLEEAFDLGKGGFGGQLTSKRVKHLEPHEHAQALKKRICPEHLAESSMMPSEAIEIRRECELDDRRVMAMSMSRPRVQSETKPKKRIRPFAVEEASHKQDNGNGNDNDSSNMNDNDNSNMNDNSNCNSNSNSNMNDNDKSNTHTNDSDKENDTSRSNKWSESVDWSNLKTPTSVDSLGSKDGRNEVELKREIMLKFDCLKKQGKSATDIVDKRKYKSNNANEQDYLSHDFVDAFLSGTLDDTLTHESKKGPINLNSLHRDFLHQKVTMTSTPTLCNTKHCRRDDLKKSTAMLTDSLVCKTTCRLPLDDASPIFLRKAKLSPFSSPSSPESCDGTNDQ
ncbi:MIF4G domain protein, partial [Reticulomyxa filosa]